MLLKNRPPCTCEGKKHLHGQGVYTLNTKDNEKECLWLATFDNHFENILKLCKTDTIDPLLNKPLSPYFSPIKPKNSIRVFHQTRIKARPFLSKRCPAIFLSLNIRFLTPNSFQARDLLRFLCTVSGHCEKLLPKQHSGSRSEIAALN